MITDFGKYVRKKRIDKTITLRTMADQIGLSASYLSSVETGKRNITSVYFESVVSYFKLDKEEREELQKLADISQKEISVTLTGANYNQRNSAVAFARKFNCLNNDDLEKINDILKG